MARRCLVSDPHLRAVILGDRRPSQRLVAAIQAELGEAAWAFVTGQVDVLAMPGMPVVEVLASEVPAGGPAKEGEKRTASVSGQAVPDAVENKS